MERYQIIKEEMKNWGAYRVSFAYLGENLPEGLNTLKYAVSFFIRLSDAIINQIEDKPTHTYFHHYRTVNTLIDIIGLRTSLLIQDWGYNAISVPASQTVKTADDPYTGIFQHKTAARLGGLGWIGKNGLLITPEFGPRVRLGTVLTDMELPAYDSALSGGCGGCDICRRMCPAMAIYGVNWHEGAARSEIIDAEACSRYMNEKFKGIGRGSVCGICIKACPVGNRVIKKA